MGKSELIKKVTVCEDYTSSYQAINPKKIFFPEFDHSVVVLVELNQIKKELPIFFEWYTQDSDVPLCTYKIDIKGKSLVNRYVVNGLSLIDLLAVKELNIYQGWKVIVKIALENYEVNFSLKKLLITNNKSSSAFKFDTVG